jgi:peptide-methionine (S)-S-oxide reductase
MNRISAYLSAILISGSLSSCGQPVSSQTAKQVAHNFQKDVIPNDVTHYSQATFAAGCFWHEETLFESINGVVKAVSGYAGGTAKNPTYEDVETGTTGHAETVNVYYDSSKVSYATLLKVYFESMEDPTQVNGQGPDEGTQYRSIAFYRNNKEKTMAEEYISKLNKSGKYKSIIATQVVPFTIFWKAEDYHQRYINTHFDEPYVSNVSIRDIARFQASHPELIKPGHNFALNK